MIALTVRCVAGPDAGWSQHLPEGRHIIGRAPTVEVSIDDPAIEPHHAFLHIASDAIRVLQLSGRHPISIENPSEDASRRPRPESADDAWTTATPGAALQLGHSRIRLGTDPGSTPVPRPYVYVPLDASARERTRFERDLRAAVDAAQAVRRLDATRIVLGEGRSSIAVELRDGLGNNIRSGDLDHDVQRLVDRVTRPVTTVTMRPDAVLDGSSLAVVAPDPEPVIDSIVSQLAPADRRGVRIMPIERDGAPPLGCAALLEVGDTWQGTWQPDLIGRPDRSTRLHVAGRSPRRGQPSVLGATGRSSLSR